MAQARRNFGSALICGRNPAGRHGVSTESGSDRVKADSNNRDCQDYYPVATALGTDLILKLGHYSSQQKLDKSLPPPASPERPSQTSLLSSEPVMRIALSTDVRSATISTTAKLINVSEVNPASQPLETARVRVESRLLSPSRQTNN